MKKTKKFVTKMFLFFLVLFLTSNVKAQDEDVLVIDDFEDISDWNLILNNGASIEKGSNFGGNTLILENKNNYGDNLQKITEIYNPSLDYNNIFFYFYNYEPYSDLLLKITDRDGVKSCISSVSYGFQENEWILYNRTLKDFQDCLDKNFRTIGKVELIINNYPTKIEITPIKLLSLNSSEINKTLPPGKIKINNININPNMIPIGRGISITADVFAESYIHYVVLNLYSKDYSKSFLMERIKGNDTLASYRYVFIPEENNPHGNYDFTIKAIDYGGNESTTSYNRFIVNSTLNLNLQYNQTIEPGKTLIITGNSTDCNNIPVSGSVTLSLGNLTETKEFLNNFAFSYFVPSDTPIKSVKNFAISVEDNKGNSGVRNASFFVSPELELSSTLIPPQGVPGDRIFVNVNISYKETKEPVSGLNLTINNKNSTLKEINPGVYEGYMVLTEEDIGVLKPKILFEETAIKELNSTVIVKEKTFLDMLKNPLVIAAFFMLVLFVFLTIKLFKNQ